MYEIEGLQVRVLFAGHCGIPLPRAKGRLFGGASESHLRTAVRCVRTCLFVCCMYFFKQRARSLLLFFLLGIFLVHNRLVEYSRIWMHWRGTSLSSTAPKTLPSLSWSPPLLTGHTHASLALYDMILLCIIWHGYPYHVSGIQRGS